jgi:hypothetical protein
VYTTTWQSRHFTYCVKPNSPEAFVQEEKNDKIRSRSCAKIAQIRRDIFESRELVVRTVARPSTLPRLAMLSAGMTAAHNKLRQFDPTSSFVDIEIEFENRRKTFVRKKRDFGWIRWLSQRERSRPEGFRLEK